MLHAISRRSWFGVGLVVIGALLLLSRMDLLTLDGRTLLWGAVMVLGLYRLVVGFMEGGRGVFLGAAVAAVGGYQLLRHYHAAYIPPYLMIPSIMVLAGAAIFLSFMASPRRWHLLIPSVVLAGFGTLMILAEEGALDRWDVIDFVHTWWPAALVLFGAALLLSRWTELRKGNGRPA